MLGRDLLGVIVQGAEDALPALVCGFRQLIDPGMELPDRARPARAMEQAGGAVRPPPAPLPARPMERAGGAVRLPASGLFGCERRREVARPVAPEQFDQARVVEMHPGLAVHAG